MSSKNNPENRGRLTELRRYNGEECVPILLIDPTNRMRYIAAAFKGNGQLVCGADGRPIPYKNI
ncbi:MAG: hypothetical protein EAZ52_06090 [Alphaproteobacteria bacterium]|nr:MAG: hypothetical protein EAZ52_06090 [Alphaproteobacteria bacterium]